MGLSRAASRVRAARPASPALDSAAARPQTAGYPGKAAVRSPLSVTEKPHDNFTGTSRELHGRGRRTVSSLCTATEHPAKHLERSCCRGVLPARSPADLHE